ncbi:hypothetical protein POX_a00722 [Penicillium oxalicum]|uniref:hypothetical protein n=1 Tax=Penicillium oxalicum TaxID=69781 RepID=UPI0020B777A8|nr:hypothetical protein POX_a00722 [Penicillium oxalicum]KAI2794132.1 hypothetical protein POX_a00722 [Penicillium oxalicum]
MGLQRRPIQSRPQPNNPAQHFDLHGKVFAYIVSTSYPNPPKNFELRRNARANAQDNPSNIGNSTSATQKPWMKPWPPSPAEKNRLDGVIAAAGVNHLGNATDHTEQDIDRVMRINYIGAFHTATAAANYMRLHNSLGSILLVASMSGLIANKGMVSPVYNSSKAAVIQCARQFGVNSLCPGHIATPMAQMVMDKSPETKKVWESENMLGRLAQPGEFAGPAIFLLSDASSFVTGSTVVIDGGHTAW